MTETVDISRRVWIRWGASAPSENTSTLVLTAPSQSFVDVRILNPISPSQPPLLNSERSSDTSQLDWAFSGIATTEYRSGICHKTWRHDADSRCAYGGEPPVDEGDMFPESDGVRCLERGRMVNPATVQMTEYEEMWESLEPEMTGRDGVRYCLVAGVGGSEAEACRARGTMVRVGQYIQCLLIVDDEINVERWVYGREGVASAEMGDGVITQGGWVRVAKLGPRVLPCVWFFRAEKCREGETFVNETLPLTWTLKEKASW